MAVPNSNFDQLSAITRRYFVEKIDDNIFDSIALLQRAKKNNIYKSVEGGTKIICPLNYATNSSGGWYTRAGTLSTTDTDVITSAEYEWKFLYENVTIFGTDEMKNQGKAAVLKYVEQKVDICKATIANRLGTSLYSDGTTAEEIVGLRAIVDGSSTVGGISQSSNSWWAGQESADTTMTLASLNSLFSACSVGNDRPSVLTSDSDQWDRYYNLLSPQQRFQDKQSADGGFLSLMFRSAPWLDDAAAPANTLFMLNEKYLHLWYHSKRNFSMKDFQDTINQDAKVAKIFWMGALGSSNNRMHGKVAYTA